MSNQTNTKLKEVDMKGRARMYKLHSSDLLRTLMRRTGTGASVTIRELATAAGCPRGTVGNLLTGFQECVPEDTAWAIADSIGVDLLVLFTPTGRSVPASEPELVTADAA